MLTAGNRVHFEIPKYDRSKPLVIDPVLSYATYLGGTGGDVAYGIAVDSSGNAYITGITNSSGFPVFGPEQNTNKGNGDAFVTKLNPAGTALLYSTYLGGTGADTATGIAVDLTGDAFVTGTTTSSDFPVTLATSTTPGAFQTTYGGNGDAFVTQLNSVGSALVYSSYLGGHGADFGQAVAVDSAGNAYVTGSTQSNDFPVVGLLQPAPGGSSDAFVAKVNFSGSALVYSSYLGGVQADSGQSIKVDSSGNAYVAGYTFSPDFPLQNPYQGANAGAPDAFVAKLNAAGSALVYSTYLGGSGDDRAYAIALDSTGNAYVAGKTQSTDFPTFSTTLNVLQGQNAGGTDAFIAKLSASGASLTYSTYLGGTGFDQANGITVDSSGDAFVTGFTQSSDFPTASPTQALLGIRGGSACGTTLCSDAFVTEVNPAGSGLVYSTYLGGNSADFGQSIALGPAGATFVTGSAASSNFPAIAGAFQGSLAGVAGNAFVAKMSSANSPGIAMVPQTLDFGDQTVGVRSSAETVSIINEGTAPLSITAITLTAPFTESDNCTGGNISPGGGTCTLTVWFTPTATGAATDSITITDNASGSPHTLTATGTGVTAATAVTVSPTSLSFSHVKVGSVSDPQTVTLTNTGNSVLNITGVTVSGDFIQTNTCGALLNLLNVGQSCSFSVSFQPVGTGARTGNLSISDNASGSPQTVTLSGTGDAVYSLSSTSPKTTIDVGNATATFSVSAAAATSFTGNITLACSSGVTCSFNPSTIFVGQSSTLTVSNLTAGIANPFNFTVSGISGSQSATLSLTILLADFSLSVSPALNTIVSGQPAGYTVAVTPSNGFSKSVQLGCANLAPGDDLYLFARLRNPQRVARDGQHDGEHDKEFRIPRPALDAVSRHAPREWYWLTWLAVLAVTIGLWKRYADARRHGFRYLLPRFATLGLAIALLAALGAFAVRPLLRRAGHPQEITS